MKIIHCGCVFLNTSVLYTYTMQKNLETFYSKKNDKHQNLITAICEKKNWYVWISLSARYSNFNDYFRSINLFLCAPCLVAVKALVTSIVRRSASFKSFFKLSPLLNLYCFVYLNSLFTLIFILPYHLSG